MNTNELNLLAKKYEDDGNEEMVYRCYLENAMSETDGKSLYELGKRYLWGDYVNEDREKAAHYFKMAHEAGYKLPGSAYIIIACSIEEQKIETWESEMKWYHLAIANGCEHGYECIGCMYMQKGDYGKAIEYFLAPNIKGTTSLYHLGKIYDEGLGVESDMEKAIEYYKRTIYDCWDVKDYGDELFDKALVRLKELGIKIVEPA